MVAMATSCTWGRDIEVGMKSVLRKQDIVWLPYRNDFVKISYLSKGFIRKIRYTFGFYSLRLLNYLSSWCRMLIVYALFYKIGCKVDCELWLNFWVLEASVIYILFLPFKHTHTKNKVPSVVDA